MKRIVLVVFFVATTLLTFAQNHILQYTTGSSGVSGATGSVIYQDANYNIGIGTTGPSGFLDVTGSPGVSGPTGIIIQADYTPGTSSSPGIPPNYFIAKRSVNAMPDFSINSVGQASIGTGPNFIINSGYSMVSDLTIQNHLWNSSPDIGQVAIGIIDDNNYPLVESTNMGSSETPAGGLFILSNSVPITGRESNPAFAVIDQSGALNNILMALGIGIVGVGPVGGSRSASSFGELEVDYNNSPADNLFHIGNYNMGNPDLFNVANDGVIGIGQLNAGAGVVEVSDVNGYGAYIPLLIVDNGDYGTTTPYFKLYGSSGGINAGIGIDPLTGGFNSTLALQGAGGTALDLSGGGAEIRFNEACGTCSSGVTDHMIFNSSSTTLVIYPDVPSYPANNGLLEVEGNQYTTGRAGIGIDPTGLTSTLSLQGTTGTSLDIYDGTGGGWDPQIRFLNSAGTNVRSIIADNQDDGMLTIIPGFNNNTWGAGPAKNVVNIQGKLLIGGPTDLFTPSTTSDLSNTYSLIVDNGILTEMEKVAVRTTADWSDYVFDNNYKLPTFNQLENYITTNKHLPDVPSAEDVVCNGGIDVAKMDAKLLQKIEELNLYVIQLEKENKKQDALIEELLKRVK